MEKSCLAVGKEWVKAFRGADGLTTKWFHPSVQEPEQKGGLELCVFCKEQLLAGLGT